MNPPPAPQIESLPLVGAVGVGANGRAQDTAPATGQRLPASLRLALAGNAVIRTAGPASAVLLTTYYLPAHQVVSATVVGAITASFYVTELSCSPLLGALGDRRGRGLLLLAGPLVGAVAVGLLGFTTAVALLVLAQLLQGLSTAATTPAILGRLSEETDGDAPLRGRVLSIFEVTTALGTLVGTAGAAALWIGLGRASFAIPALLYALAAALFSRTRDPRGGIAVAARHDWRASLGLIVRQRALLAFLPAWLALSAITNLWLTHALYQMRVVRPAIAGQYLSGRFADNPTGLGLLVLTFLLVFSAGAIGWGYLGLRRLHELIVMRVGLTAMLGVCAAIWAVNHSGDSAPLRAGATIGYFLLVLAESGFAPAAVAYLARLSGRLSTDRGLVMGLYTVVTGGGSLLGATIGGPFADRAAIDGVLIATVLLALTSLGLLALLSTREGG